MKGQAEKLKVMKFHGGSKSNYWFFEMILKSIFKISAGLAKSKPEM